MNSLLQDSALRPTAYPLALSLLGFVDKLRNHSGIGYADCMPPPHLGASPIACDGVPNLRVQTSRAVRVLLALFCVINIWTAELVPPPGSHEKKLEGFRLISQCDSDVDAEIGKELVRARGSLSAWLSQRIKPLPAKLPPLPVYLFADRAAFQTFAKSNARNVATAHAEGFYSGDGTPGGGMLCLFRDGGRELSTARHELVHYLLDQILPARAGQPVWFNEGLAVSAEDAWLDPGAVRPSAVPLQREIILRKLALEGGAPLATITALGSDGWLSVAGRDREAADAQYAASYGAVLFLLNRHPDQFWLFLGQMAGGESHDVAYATMAKQVPGGLDAAWRTWVARSAWETALAADGEASAANAFERGMALMPEHFAPGDIAEAGRWLSGAARGFALVDGYELDAAAAWLAASRAWTNSDPSGSGTAAETAAELYGKRHHLAGQTDALIQATRAWGDDQGKGDWNRAATLGRQAVQLAEAIGPDQLRASANATYGACFIPGRATAVPGGGDPRTEAKATITRARALHKTLGHRDLEASIVLLLAQAMVPGDGADGDWSWCLDLTAEAESIWRDQPETPARLLDIARAINIRAGFYRPDRNPRGSWTHAAELYAREAELIPADDTTRRLRNRIDLGNCRLGLGDHARAATEFTAAEQLAETAGDTGLLAFSAYQLGAAQLSIDPAAATAAFLRAEPRYRELGKTTEEAMAVGQAAQTAQKANLPVTQIITLYGRAAELERARGDHARVGYYLYQQAWFSEPIRLANADKVICAALYAHAAASWKQAGEIAKASQALGQRARLLTPVKGAAAGWAESARAWGDSAAALAVLPEADRRLADRGSALHQQAWCLIRGDGQRMTPEAKRLFQEAVRLQRAGGDDKGADVSASWIRE